MGYPLDNALFLWEEGNDRLRELSANPRAYRVALRAVESIRDGLRRRIGQTFTAQELAQGLGAAYDWARLTHDQSIALSGTLGGLYQYGLWGEDGSNDVRYIGQKGSRGSFYDITTCPEWIGAINNGNYDYVVTTPTYNQDNPAADTTPPAKSWIEHAGNVRHVAGSNLVDVWQITGPLDPIACVPGVPAATG